MKLSNHLNRLRHLVSKIALATIFVLGSLWAEQGSVAQENKPTESEWVDLFNGKDLDGWTVKIAGHPVGENYADTFRVEDGILKCEYDDYKEFGDRFGHLYTSPILTTSFDWNIVLKVVSCPTRPTMWTSTAA